MKITKDAMYPRPDDTWTIYLKNAITNPAILLMCDKEVIEV